MQTTLLKSRTILSNGHLNGISLTEKKPHFKQKVTGTQNYF